MLREDSKLPEVNSQDLQQIKTFKDLILQNSNNSGSALEEGLRQAKRSARALSMGNEELFKKFITFADIAYNELVELRQEHDILRKTGGVRLRGDSQDALFAPWYLGTLGNDGYWPRLRDSLKDQLPQDVVASIDGASHDVVSNLANPKFGGTGTLKKKGLVLGFVQSGKTANYTAVAAKALDQGYKLIIVLSGIHNNLREQTQERVTRDLGLDEVSKAFKLTSSGKDFKRDTNAASILSGGNPAIAVVKKNKSVLEGLRLWLKSANQQLQRTPVLIIDDEADQATPNTQADRDEVSAINKLVREIWSTVRLGTYVGYTATPFANVFMDPDEPKELFPSHFILTLEKPSNYFGAEQIFGSFDPADAENPEPGLDMVRVVQDSEAEMLRPNKSNRTDFDFTVPESLIDAVRWFVIATAIRRARGQRSQHATMLVHTTHYAAPHFVIQTRIATVARSLRDAWAQGGMDVFRSQFEFEKDRVSSVRTKPMPAWELVAREISDVLSAISVVVDNSAAKDRLDYSILGPDGAIVPQTVIVVGGGTLSRGLTLEGLLVSYFVRTSNAYDTLLQMGRWFGYRNGYEDLPRVWTQESLVSDYQFLAQVESEIRSEINSMRETGLTPDEAGLKIRRHPGRLEITAKSKMVHANFVGVSYGGKRLQTHVLSKSLEDLNVNKSAAKKLVENLKLEPGVRMSSPLRSSDGYLFQNVPTPIVKQFLVDFSFHKDLKSMDSDGLAQWMDKFAAETPWNVVFVSGPKHTDLEPIDLGLPEDIKTINRSRLRGTGDTTASIKALMSRSDIILDINKDIPFDGENEDDIKFYRKFRQSVLGNTGLLVIYSISKDSVPKSTSSGPSAREPMEAKETVIGVGLNMPFATEETISTDGDFVSVRASWSINDDDAAELLDEETN